MQGPRVMTMVLKVARLIHFHSPLDTRCRLEIAMTTSWMATRLILKEWITNIFSSSNLCPLLALAAVCLTSLTLGEIWSHDQVASWPINGLRESQKFYSCIKAIKIISIKSHHRVSMNIIISCHVCVHGLYRHLRIPHSQCSVHERISCSRIKYNVQFIGE